MSPSTVTHYSFGTHFKYFKLKGKITFIIPASKLTFPKNSESQTLKQTKNGIKERGRRLTVTFSHLF
jgi:hypothetical protein